MGAFRHNTETSREIFLLLRKNAVKKHTKYKKSVVTMVEARAVKELSWKKHRRFFFEFHGQLSSTKGGLGKWLY